MFNMSLIIHFGLLLAALAVLAWSADRFVDAAARLSLRSGLSMTLVGVVVVGFGTSAPEILVSALSALEDRPELAVGNAIGSNIANIALILGLTACVTPIRERLLAVRTAYTMAALASVILVPLLMDGQLSRGEGLLLLLLLPLALGWLIRRPDAAPVVSIDGRPVDGAAHDGTQREPLPALVGWLLLALILLLLGAQLLVHAASTLARLVGISELVIGLSIVALGTSLPELATTLAAARQRRFGLVIGNILGSNLFNLLAVLGLAAVIMPPTLDTLALVRDAGLMNLLLVILGLLLWRGGIGRWAGGLLIGVYIVYQIVIYTT
jgi:cation:H+ antiporter